MSTPGFGLLASRTEVIDLLVLEPKEKKTGQVPRAMGFQSQQGLRAVTGKLVCVRSTRG